MKSIKYLLCALLATAFVGCTEDTDFEAGPIDSGASIYFPSQTTSVVLMPDDETVAEFTVSRANTEEAATYEFEFAGDADGVLVLETSALSFTAGAESATLKISFPSAEIGVSYSGSITITDEQAAVYKQVVLNFSVMRSYTWELMVGDDGSTTGIWTDELLGLYGVSALSAPVSVYEAAEVPGYLKVVGLYTDDFFLASTGVSAEDFGMSSISSTAVDIYIHAEDPTAVWIPEQNTGMIVDPDYGEMVFGTICEANGFSSSSYATLVDNVIVIPASTLYVYETLDSSSLYYANSGGATGLSLPGASPVAEIESVSYTGLFTAASGDMSAMFDIVANENTASVLYTVVTSDTDVAAEAEAIIAGTVESTELTSFGSFSAPIIEGGTYYVVAVPFNVDGVAGAYSTCKFKIVLGEVETASVLADGTYTLSGYSYYDSAWFDEDVTISYVDASTGEVSIAGMFYGYCSGLVTGYYDATAQTITIPDWQLLGDVDFGSYGVSSVYFSTASEGLESIVFTLGADGETFATDMYWGYYLYDIDGWYDVFIQSTLLVEMGDGTEFKSGSYVVSGYSYYDSAWFDEPVTISSIDASTGEATITGMFYGYGSESITAVYDNTAKTITIPDWQLIGDVDFGSYGVSSVYFSTASEGLESIVFTLNDEGIYETEMYWGYYLYDIDGWYDVFTAATITLATPAAGVAPAYSVKADAPYSIVSSVKAAVAVKDIKSLTAVNKLNVVPAKVSNAVSKPAISKVSKPSNRMVKELNKSAFMIK